MNLDFGEFIPHVTLINVTDRDMPRLKLAAVALPSLDKLVLDGINFLLDGSGRCVWVEIRTQKTAWMIEVRKRLLALLNDIHPGLDVDAFRPHITLGCVDINVLDDVNMSTVATRLPIIATTHTPEPPKDRDGKPLYTARSLAREFGVTVNRVIRVTKKQSLRAASGEYGVWRNIPGGTRFY